MCQLPYLGQGLGLELTMTAFLSVFFILGLEGSNLKHMWNWSPGHRVLTLYQPGKPDTAMAQTPSLNQAGSSLRKAQDTDSPSQSNYTTHSFSRLWVTFPLSSQALMAPSSGTGHIVATHVFPTPLLVYVGTVMFPSVLSWAFLCHVRCPMLWKAPVSVRSINTVKMSADN